MFKSQRIPHCRKTNKVLEEVTDTAYSRSAVKQNLERYIQIGPGQLETLVIFNSMRDTFSKAYVVLDNLKRLHKVKAEFKSCYGYVQQHNVTEATNR